MKDLKYYSSACLKRDGYIDVFSGVCDGSYEPFSSAFYSIVLLKGGTGTASINGHDLLLRPQSMVITRPNDVVDVRSAVGLNFKELSFRKDLFGQMFVTDELFSASKVLSDGHAPHIYDIDATTFAALLACIDSIDAVLDNDNTIMRRYAVMARLIDVLCMASGLYAGDGSVLASSADKQKLLSFQQLVDAHYAERLGLDYYSSILCMSVSGLYKFVKSTTGMSPIRFINERRLHEARQLLLYTDYSDDEIAQKSGFSDGRSFRRKFFEATGERVSEFRKKTVR